MVFTPVSKIFKVYHGDQFYIGKRNTLKTTDLHGIDKHYNIKLYRDTLKCQGIELSTFKHLFHM